LKKDHAFTTPLTVPPEDLVGMGYVMGAFGVRGWIKIHVDTEYPDSLFEYTHWWLKLHGVWKIFHLLEGSVHTKALVAKLEGIEDREAAALLRGAEIAVSRALMPEPEEDTYYWADLMGLTVINEAQETLGRVEKLLETGANDVLVVKNEEVERLIPFVAAVIRKVDANAGTILVNWDADF
jgi:16S rRNA processing protein RimM